MFASFENRITTGSIKQHFRAIVPDASLTHLILLYLQESVDRTMPFQKQYSGLLRALKQYKVKPSPASSTTTLPSSSVSSSSSSAPLPSASASIAPVVGDDHFDSLPLQRSASGSVRISQSCTFRRQRPRSTTASQEGSLEHFRVPQPAQEGDSLVHNVDDDFLSPCLTTNAIVSPGSGSSALSGFQRQQSRQQSTNNTQRKLILEKVGKLTGTSFLGKYKLGKPGTTTFLGYSSASKNSAPMIRSQSSGTTNINTPASSSSPASGTTSSSPGHHQKRSFAAMMQFGPDGRPIYHQYPPDAKELPPHKFESIIFTYEVSNQKDVCAVSADSKTLLDVMEEYEIPVEAACDGIAACSTCHCWLTEDDWKKFPPPEDSEIDMLELAAGYIEGRSRLGCQLELWQGSNRQAGDSGVEVVEKKGDGAGSAEKTGRTIQHDVAGDLTSLTVQIPRDTNNLMDFIPFEDNK